MTKPTVGLPGEHTGYSRSYNTIQEKNMATAEHDVSELVVAQHGDVGQRLSAVLSKTGSDRTDEFESLAKFLPVHEAAEQAVIYPALLALGDEGHRIVEARTQEEVAASDLITTLKGLDTGSVEFETMFIEFSAKVHQHAASEEAEVLPLLNSNTTLERRQAMGEEFLASQMGVPSHR
jgi:hemerythrin superfamily protein